MVSYYPEEYNDMLIEEEESPYVQDTSTSTTWSYEKLNPKIYVDYLVEFIATNGWLLLFLTIVGFYLFSIFRDWYKKQQQKWEDAEHHKDPDKELARMEAIQRAREAQQRLLEEASRRAREQQQQQQERKRLQKLSNSTGQRLGTPDDDYMPLSSPASASTYRPPKRSACGGGGCGR